MTTDTRLTLPPERIGHPAAADLVERRGGLAAAAAAGLWRTDPPPITETIAGVRTLRFEPPGPSRGVVLHFHGGAFRLGAPEVVAKFAAALAERCQVTVLAAAYRLAPENPFPAGIADGRAVLRALQAQGAGPLILSGDSAGGGVAASVTALAVAEGAPPAGLVLLSPWLDLTVSSPCYETNAATDPLFSRDSAEQAAELYLQGMSPNDPLASPLLGPVNGFPPTFVSIGEGEVLADDGRGFHTALLAAGVKTSLSAIPGMEHVAVTRGFELTGATQTFDEVATFIDGVTGRRA